MNGETIAVKVVVRSIFFLIKLAGNFCSEIQAY